MPFTDFLFPPLCLHCHAKTEHLLCEGCAGQFELIDPTTRCPYCFKENDGRRVCQECVQKKRFVVQIASCLDYLGPVSSLVKQLKYGRRPYLAKTAAAFCIAQLERLEWPTPDLIVPVPRRMWFKGENHAALIAKRLAEQLNISYKPIVKRLAGDLPQACLSLEQREMLPTESFYLHLKYSLAEKTVLLVDDVVTTGTTLHHVAQVLQDAYPKKIYALSFARSIQVAPE